MDRNFLFIAGLALICLGYWYYTRIWSIVLKVEAQQLKDITEEDAMAEGMSEKVATYLGYSLINHHPDDGTYYRHLYKYLWGHLNGDWFPDLWVWKYTMTEPEIKQ